VKEMGWIIFGLIVIVLFLLLYFMRFKVKINIRYSPQEKSAKSTLIVQQHAFSNYMLLLGKNDKNELKIDYFKNGSLIRSYLLKEFIDQVKRKKGESDLNITKMIDYFPYQNKMRLDELSIYIDLGCEDAAVTAILMGILKSGVNIALARLYDLKGVPSLVTVKLNPFFQKNIFNAQIETVLSMRLGYSVMAGVRILYTFLKERREEKRQKLYGENAIKKSA
jgi:hypothetical protein